MTVWSGMDDGRTFPDLIPPAALLREGGAMRFDLLLRTQCEHLALRTDGLLTAEVMVTGDDEILRYAFVLSSPRIPGFSMELFRIERSPDSPYAEDDVAAVAAKLRDPGVVSRLQNLYAIAAGERERARPPPTPAPFGT